MSVLNALNDAKNQVAKAEATIATMVGGAPAEKKPAFEKALDLTKKCTAQIEQAIEVVKNNDDLNVTSYSGPK